MAQQFTTGGETNGYELDSLVMRVNSGGSGSQTFGLYTSTANNEPGLLLANLAGDVQEYGWGRFIPDQKLKLKPSTKYFVVMQDDSPSITMGGARGNDEDDGSLSGWSIGDAALTRSGETWTASSAGVSAYVSVLGAASPPRPTTPPPASPPSAALRRSAGR